MKKEEEKKQNVEKERDPIFNDERLKGWDEELIERILSEIVDNR